MHTIPFVRPAMLRPNPGIRSWDRKQVLPLEDMLLSCRNVGKLPFERGYLDGAGVAIALVGVESGAQNRFDQED